MERNLSSDLQRLLRQRCLNWQVYHFTLFESLLFGEKMVCLCKEKFGLMSVSKT